MLIKGLINNSINIIECNEKSKTFVEVNKGRYIINSFKNSLKLLKKLIVSHNFDLVIVGYPGFDSVLQVKRLTNKPIIYDPFISSYLSYVYDYKYISEKSLLAKISFFIDYFSFKEADLILSDTKIHGKIFSKLFNQKPSKIKTILVGSDPEIFYPREYKKDKNKFIVGVYGTYIPLQGIKVIIEAAKILKRDPELKFEIIGGKPGNVLFQEIIKFRKKYNLNNVELIPHIPLSQLPEKIERSDVQLGIFGGTLKSNIVIPNKVYSALAMKKPIRTANTIAGRDLLTHENNVYLCKNANGVSLVKSITILYEDKNLRDKIARNGYKLFERDLTPQKLGNDLKKIFLKLL